jgi:nucleoside-diphosphate-sugar epimerase
MAMTKPPEAGGRDPALPYKSLQILITGGFGLIGSALARKLVAAGAQVRILDNLDPDSGANRANLSGLEDRIDARIADLRDRDAVRHALAGADVVFNLAAQTSHMGSMAAPQADHQINAAAQLALLEAVREIAPQTRIVYASTRQIYGRPDRLPVDETHPLRPVDVNGVGKLAGEAFHLIYHRVHGIKATALRLTNTYGPGMRIKDARQTFIGIWLRAAMEGKPFEVWGGAQRRDFTFADDAADAFLLAGMHDACFGRAFNIGGDGPHSLGEVAQLLVEVAGGGRFDVKEFPSERRRIDIGEYWADDRLFRSVTGWSPTTRLREGLQMTLAFFRPRLATYV